MNVQRKPWCIIALVLGLGVLSGCASNPELAPDKARDASRFNAELGAKYLQRGNLELARDKLEKALDQDQRNALAHVTYAKLQQRINRDRQAREHFERAIALAPEEAEHRNSFGIFLCEEGDYSAAEAEFQQAATNPYYETPEYAFDNAGICMLDANRIDKAEDYLREALRENPQFANAYLHMAELLLRQQRLTVADAYYQRYQAYGAETAESLLLAVSLKREMGDRAGAQALAERLLDRFPASGEAGEYLATPLN